MMSLIASFCVVLFPRDVFDEIWDLIESVSEGFPSYFCYMLTTWTILQSFSSSDLTECWLVGCFGFNGPLRQYFSLYRAVSQREGERKDDDDEFKFNDASTQWVICV